MSEVQEQLQKEQEGSIKDRESQALKGAGVKIEDNTYKIDLRQDAVQKQSTDEGVLRAEEPKVGLQEMVKGDKEPEIIAETEEGLELITEEKDELYSKESQQNEERKVQTEQAVVEQKQEEQKVVLPENIQSLVDFMNETGGTVEDFVRLNADYSNISDTALLKEYYKQTKPHLSDDEITFLIEDNFDYDEDLDDNKEIKRKKLAYKEELTKARGFLTGLKDKYYKEIKTNSRLSAEQKDAIEFYNAYKNRQNELTAEQQKQSEQFTKLTDQVFNEEFKGFDFKVGENKYRYKVNDAQQIKKAQSNIVDAFKMFLNEDNTLKDAQGYHKALFAARNADSLANHFYEQGKADAIKQLEAESKNINMSPRRTSDGMVETGGIKLRVMSGDDSSKLRVKMKK